jgi:hypothetical protein
MSAKEILIDMIVAQMTVAAKCGDTDIGQLSKCSDSDAPV